MRVRTYIHYAVLGGLVLALTAAKGQAQPLCAEVDSGPTGRGNLTPEQRARWQKEMDFCRREIREMDREIREQAARLQKSVYAREASAAERAQRAELRQKMLADAEALRSEVAAQMEAKDSELEAVAAQLRAEQGDIAAQAQAKVQQLFSQTPGVFRGGEDTGWLGVEISEVTPAKAKSLSLPAVRGVLVTEVTPDGPAAKAGLQSGDVILDYDGHVVEGTVQFSRLVRETPPGRTVELTVMRNGQERKWTVQLGSRPQGMESQAREFVLPRDFNFKFSMPEFSLSPTPVLGIEAENVSGQLGAYFHVPGGEGVLIQSENAGSPAAKAGLQAGDVITRVDGQAVKTIGDLRAELRQKREQKSVTLAIIRQGSPQTVRVALAPPPSPHPAVIRSAAI